MKDNIWFIRPLNYDEGPIAMRFPRGNGLGVPLDEDVKRDSNRNMGSIERRRDAAILTFGTTIPMAMEAAALLEKQGIFG